MTRKGSSKSKLQEHFDSVQLAWSGDFTLAAGYYFDYYGNLAAGYYIDYYNNLVGSYYIDSYSNLGIDCFNNLVASCYIDCYSSIKLLLLSLMINN